jgi:hypothetical protein
VAHATDREIEEFSDGTLASADRRRLVRHLISRCPVCGPRVSAALRHRTHFFVPPREEISYTVVVDRAIRKFRLAWGLARVRETQTRTIQPWTRVEVLLQLSREARHRDPVWMLDQAKQAQEVADRIETTPYGQAFLYDLRTRAWIELANALRVNKHHGEAESALWSARALAEQGSGDPMLRARLNDVEGSLRKDQRRYIEAGALMSSAHRIYLKIGENARAERVLKKKDLYLRLADRPLQTME